LEQFVTIATFTYPSEYAVLRLLLEREEIPHVFQNETMIGVLPFHSNAVGGIRLKVHESDVTKATEIITQLNQSDHLRIV
tara:strand:+ start:2229 stop:2468 length:240 start_codon:yes stop_codon:yes gene_type:complete